MHLNKKYKLRNTVKYINKRKNKNIRKSKHVTKINKYKIKKNKSKKRNYEEMYYQPVNIPLIAFRSKSLKKTFRRI